MNLHIRVRYLKDIGLNSEKLRKITHYYNDDQYVDVDADAFTDAQLTKLFEKAKTDKNKEGTRALCQRITSYRNVRSDPTGSRIGRLEALSVALTEYIGQSPNKWVFLDKSDGNALPYFVTKIAFEKANPKHNQPACVAMEIAALQRSESAGTTVRFHSSCLGKTVTEILNEAGYYLETEAAVERYWSDIELYKKWATLTGEQFRCVGIGYPLDRYSYVKETEMERDGIPATVVMDDSTRDDGEDHRSSRDGRHVASTNFWITKRSVVEEDDEDDGEDDGEGSGAPAEEVVVPMHPYVKVFDLVKHGFALVHVRSLTPYEYDETVADKLVLPKQTKALVDILVQGSSEVMEDIIRGKTGGTIVIATGPPGTGKTLTAEVFSEKIHRPLYVVQCSQLGTDEEQVEKQLQIVLARATRWQAILLIDEADVYVHTRGTDIQQNAIVGVFLRVLEHYRGVLFLTSNRSTIIDDAIMSRATAWIRYEYPDRAALTEIWNVLSKQYKMPLGSETIQGLLEAFPKLSGRNVKNMLKLAGMLLKRAETTKPDVKLFQYVSAFLDLKADDDKPA